MPGTAWALYLGLKERFGAKNVFLDNSTLYGGMQLARRPDLADVLRDLSQIWPLGFSLTLGPPANWPRPEQGDLTCVDQ